MKIVPYTLTSWRFVRSLQAHDCFCWFDEVCFIAVTHVHYLQLNTSTDHNFCLFMLCTLREKSSSCLETNAQ